MISKVETCGYHALEEMERSNLERFFAVAIVLPVIDDIVLQTATSIWTLT